MVVKYSKQPSNIQKTYKTHTNESFFENLKNRNLCEGLSEDVERVKTFAANTFAKTSTKTFAASGSLTAAPALAESSQKRTSIFHK